MLRLAFLAHTDALGAGNAVRQKGQIHVPTCVLALIPLSLDVHRAASRLPNFRIRRSATERPPATPSGREEGLQGLG